jgi:hypothetical protein
MVFLVIRILKTKVRPTAMAIEIATPLWRREYNKAIDKE